MRRDDWYRNTDWNADIESAFRTKLSRSRSSRPQYIQIQASQLIVRYPEVALALIGEYFETGDDFFVPSALCTQAAAYCNLGKTDEAVAAYKRALEWESLHPSFITNARIDLPRLVAEKRLSSEYEYALTILTDRFEASDHLWPNTRYIWNGSCALILADRGEITEAREFAERALRASLATESPYRHHRFIGLVEDASDELGQRIKRIARPSKLRSLLRIISSS